MLSQIYVEDKLCLIWRRDCISQNWTSFFMFSIKTLAFCDMNLFASKLMQLRHFWHYKGRLFFDLYDFNGCYLTFRSELIFTISVWYSNTINYGREQSVDMPLSGKKNVVRIGTAPLLTNILEYCGIVRCLL